MESNDNLLKFLDQHIKLGVTLSALETYIRKSDNKGLDLLTVKFWKVTKVHG